jgi:predicted TIM-barrel fold metal-dependent hydrolase
VELLGADKVIFGSDYPHPEGMSDPLAYVDEIADLPAADIEAIMGGNMYGLLGVTAGV